MYRLDRFFVVEKFFLSMYIVGAGSAVNDNTDFDAFGEKKCELHREIISEFVEH